MVSLKAYPRKEGLRLAKAIKKYYKTDTLKAYPRKEGLRLAIVAGIAGGLLISKSISAKGRIATEEFFS